MKKNFVILGIAAITVAVSTPATAQIKTDNTGSYNTGDRARSQTNVTVYEKKGGVSAGVSGSTTYQQPSQGSNSPQQGSQRGSSSSSTGGVFIRKTF